MQQSRNPRRDSFAGSLQFDARRKTWTPRDPWTSSRWAGEKGFDDTSEESANFWAHQGIVWPTWQARQWDWNNVIERESTTWKQTWKNVSLIFSVFAFQNEKQKAEEQSKLTNLLEKILSAFESSTQTSSRISENESDEDDEKLTKKVDDLFDMVKGLRREIAEFRADQSSIEVKHW